MLCRHLHQGVAYLIPDLHHTLHVGIRYAGEDTLSILHQSAALMSHTQGCLGYCLEFQLP